MQKKVTKIITGHIPYEERLQSLRLFGLEKSLNLGEGMTETYKIVHGVDEVDRRMFFSLSHNTRTEEH